MKSWSYIVLLVLLTHDGLGAGKTNTPLTRSRGARGAVLHRRTSSGSSIISSNNRVSRSQNDLLSFITERAEDGSLTCTYGKECDGGCIPDWATCCDFGGGGWCEPDLRCQKSNRGCCELDSRDCIGPGYDCESEGFSGKICGEFCVPEDSICCDNGFYCEAGEQCTRTGCIPEGAVSCGDGEYCDEGEECGEAGCTPPERETSFGVKEGACENDDDFEFTTCDHTITALGTAGLSSSTTSSTGETQATSDTDAEDEDGDSDPGNDDSDNTDGGANNNDEDNDDDDDDAASTLHAGLPSVIVMVAAVALLMG